MTYNVILVTVRVEWAQDRRYGSQAVEQRSKIKTFNAHYLRSNSFIMVF
jgi:hypothetical protein